MIPITIVEQPPSTVFCFNFSLKLRTGIYENLSMLFSFPLKNDNIFLVNVYIMTF